MKIKTITCHDVYNYGASLQAYALQAFLQQAGHDVEIIDYVPNYKPRRYQFFYLYSKKNLTGKIGQQLPFLRPICAALQNRGQLKFYGRKKKFDDFKRKKLNVTSVRYHCLGELIANKPEADLYIAGSDQIWNSVYQNGRDGAYYCEFENNPNKCISYAASFGANHIHPDYVEFTKRALGHFKKISVRESSGIKIVESLGYHATLVTDPVFLLDVEQWERLCKVDRRGDYILLYDFLQNDSNVRRFVKKLAQESCLKIISINDLKTCDYADYNINNAGPIEFLEYIRGARFIVSTSFHATAFSVMFQKEFYTFPLLGHDNSSRMIDFLTLINMQNRYIGRERSMVDDSLKNNSAQIIQDMRMISRNWLLQNI